MDFYLGTHPLFEAFRLARRIPSKPYLFGALVRLGAFAWCYCKGEKRQVPAEFVKFLRTEQMDRLRRYCPWPSSAAGRKQVSSQGMRFRESKLKRGVQLSISLLFFPLSSLARMLATIGGKYAAPGCVVLYYHAVPETQREAFARQMDVLLKWTTPISLVSAPTLSPAVRYSAITFDDFFQNVVSNALPELKKRTIPATIFVTTEVLGKRADWWPESAPERKEEIGSLEELQGLPPDLIAIGSHTLTHPKLPLLNERDAHREIFTSRQILEEWLGRKIATLSFPFGAFNDELVEWCRQARYERVFTTLPTMAFQHPGEFVTGRVKADPTDWPLEFKLKLLGAYRWLPYAFALKRRILGFPIANHRGGSNFRG
ncbi:MAG: polysaccharide deacetylase family protein [Terriglobales bacterium]